MDWCISMEHLMTLLTVLLQIAHGFSIRGHSGHNGDHQSQGQQWSPADMDRIRQLANRMQQYPSAFSEHQQQQHQQDEDRIIKSYHTKKSSSSRLQSPVVPVFSPEDQDPTSILYNNAQTSIASAARLRRDDNYKTSGLNRYWSGNDIDDIDDVITNNNFGNDDVMLSSDDESNNRGGGEEEIDDNNVNGFVDDNDDGDDVDNSIRDDGFNDMLLDSRRPSSSSSSSYSSSHQSKAIVADLDDDFISPSRSFDDLQNAGLRLTPPSKRQQGWYVQYGKRASGMSESQPERTHDNNDNNFAYHNGLNPNSNYNNIFDGFEQAQPAVSAMMQKIMTTRFLNTKSDDDDSNNINMNNNHKTNVRNNFKSKHNNKILGGEGKAQKASSLALNLELRKSIAQLKKLEKDLKISTLAYDVVKRFIEDPPAGEPRLQDQTPVKRQQGWFTQYGKRSREQVPLSIS